MATADTAVKTESSVKTHMNAVPPPFFNVIYVNDEVTTMEFVVTSLMEIFGHSQEVAEKLCTTVHEAGLAVVATLPYELAEQKGIEVTILARNNGFPLMVRLEASPE